MSSETGKRNPDRLNMLGVVVVGICGAVLVYVSIALLQAFYMNDTAKVETLADYGGQDSMQKSVKAEQLGHLDPQPTRNANGTYTIKVDKAIELVVRDAKAHPDTLIPSQGPSTKQTIPPVFGRPLPGAGAGAGSAAPAPAGAGSGSAAPAPAGAGSAAPVGAGSGSAAAPAPAGAGSGSAAPAPAGAGSGSAAESHGP